MVGEAYDMNLTRRQKELVVGTRLVVTEIKKASRFEPCITSKSLHYKKKKKSVKSFDYRKYFIDSFGGYSTSCLLFFEFVNKRFLCKNEQLDF